MKNEIEKKQSMFDVVKRRKRWCLVDWGEGGFEWVMEEGELAGWEEGGGKRGPVFFNAVILPYLYYSFLFFPRPFHTKAKLETHAPTQRNNWTWRMFFVPPKRLSELALHLNSHLRTQFLRVPLQGRTEYTVIGQICPHRALFFVYPYMLLLALLGSSCTVWCGEQRWVFTDGEHLASLKHLSSLTAARSRPSFLPSPYY